MTKIIDGKEVSEKILNEIKNEIDTFEKKPCLAVILVGDNKASQTYVKNKEKKCEQVGITSITHRLPENTSEEELLKLIYDLNSNDKVNGILVQLPLPKHINEDNVINSINVDKDVDCFHPINVGLMYTTSKHSIFKPCTPYGVIKLLEHYNIEATGKHCVILGRSNIVGKPMATLMLEKNATVTICHSKTKNLKEITKSADILISAIGKVNIITKDMVKENAVVIDVAINRNEDNKLCGDVDFENVKEITSFITPVPGGVGPMTIAMLMQNCLISFKSFNNLK